MQEMCSDGPTRALRGGCPVCDGLCSVTRAIFQDVDTLGQGGCEGGGGWRGEVRGRRGEEGGRVYCPVPHARLSQHSYSSIGLVPSSSHRPYSCCDSHCMQGVKLFVVQPSVREKDLSADSISLARVHRVIYYLTSGKLKGRRNCLRKMRNERRKVKMMKRSKKSERTLNSCMQHGDDHGME